MTRVCCLYLIGVIMHFSRVPARRKNQLRVLLRSPIANDLRNLSKRTKVTQ